MTVEFKRVSKHISLRISVDATAKRIRYSDRLRIGIHTSTSGALENAALKAVELGANTFQIFSASPRMWRTRVPDPERIRSLRAIQDKHDLRPLVIHDSYLINLAAPASETRTRSIPAFQGEIERAIAIGADYLVTHPGNYKGLSVNGGIVNVAEAMALAWRGVDPATARSAKLTILLENTAGAGAQLGGCFEELDSIRQIAQPYIDLPIGFCIDTCHAYVAGHDLANREGFTQFLRDIKAILGLGRVSVLHANDAKMPLSSHVDRHAHIGAGYIGTEGFRRILNHPDLRAKPFILETPLDEPGDDLRNVKALQELISPKQHSTRSRSNPSGTASGRKTKLST